MFYAYPKKDVSIQKESALSTSSEPEHAMVQISLPKRAGDLILIPFMIGHQSPYLLSLWN